MENIQNISENVMSKVCGTVASGIFCTTLLFSNSPIKSIYFVNSDFGYPIVSEEQISNNFYKVNTFSNSLGICQELPGYTSNNEILEINLYLDNNMNKNLEKLSAMGKLEQGWDGENANPIDINLIKLVSEIIQKLKYQPEIFPTACDSVQLEYDYINGSYLEIEITESGEAKCYMIDKEGCEKEYSIGANAKEIDKVVRDFYG